MDEQLGLRWFDTHFPMAQRASIPRDVSLDTLDGTVQLVQRPIPELRELRGDDSKVRTVDHRRHYCPRHPRQGVGDHRRVSGRYGVPVRPQGAHRFRRRDARGLRRAGGRGLRGSDQFRPIVLQQLVPGPPNGSITSRERAREAAHLRRLVFGRGLRRRWTDRITDQIFPMPSSDGLALFANGGNAKLVSLHIWPLRSIWGSH